MTLLRGRKRMAKIPEQRLYIILQTESVQSLMEIVDIKWKEGYRPDGGYQSFIVEDDRRMYGQAMSLKKAPDDKSRD